jgi:hypothetical protein
LLHFLVRLACVRHAASVDSEPGSNSRLKPDVCRRVVGRLPSPKLETWGWRHCSASHSPSRSSKNSKTPVVYLVRSFGLMPEFISHDWHVQPSCQRPNRTPPERRASGTDRTRTSANPTVLETLQTYPAAKKPSTPASHRISTSFPQWEIRRREPQKTDEQSLSFRTGPKGPVRNLLFALLAAHNQRATVCSSILNAGRFSRMRGRKNRS